MRMKNENVKMFEKDFILCVKHATVKIGVTIGEN